MTVRAGSYAKIEFPPTIRHDQNFGIERNPDLAACLHRAFEANVYNYFEVSGWVWGCGLRMEDFPE